MIPLEEHVMYKCNDKRLTVTRIVCGLLGIGFCLTLTEFAQARSRSRGGQPRIQMERQQPESVGLYERLEVTVGLSGIDYQNPFNPNEVDVGAVFTSPSGQPWTIHGFYDSTDRGGRWLLRFAPNETGPWIYTLHVIDSNGPTFSDTYSFEAVESDHRGWIRISDDDPHYLEYADDSPFMGIGQCRAWRVFGQVPTLLPDMNKAGLNTLVYWMPNWDNLLVTNATGYDRYDLRRAQEIDRVVRAAEAYDVTLILTIWNHDEIRGQGHPWNVRPYFDTENPFRFIPDPHHPSSANTFFTEEASWLYQTRLYRYIVARWGYSRAIQQWATVCEMNGTGNSSFNINNVSDYRNQWLLRINKWFRENDPFRHPVTASLSNTRSWPLGFEDMDVIQMHAYNYNNNSNGMAWAPLFANKHRNLWFSYEKPAFMGEFGTTHEHRVAEHIHYASWAALVNGAAICPLDWNDGGDWDDFGEEEYRQLSHLAAFVADCAFHKWNLKPRQLNAPSNLHAWSMVGDEHGLAWIADKTPGETIGSARVTLEALPPGTWQVRWYDTWQGEYLDTDTFTIEEALSLHVPRFRRDIALKLERLED